MRAFGPKELLEDVYQRNLCVGCGACVELCPYFRSYEGKTAMLFPCDLSQGRCYAYCPKAEVDLDELAMHYWGKDYEGDPMGRYASVFKARAGEKAPGGSFQAGGTVTALMAFALDQNIIDGAVLTDREYLIPTARLVTETREVVTCASSKYTAAPTLAAFNRAVQNGYRQIGVVGTPCQVTAVAQMRTNPMDREDFFDPVALVLGLFCTWALETRGLRKLLSRRLDVHRIRKMDIPPPPADILVVETEDGSMEIPLEDIRPLIPHGCTVCPDMTAEWADISVGILEGNAGWNTLIVRTEGGTDLVERARKAGWLLTEAMPLENLEHLRFAAANKKKRCLTKALEENLVNSSGRSCLRINPRAIEHVTAEQKQ
ncbi:MAG: Coenzyme F420 hydrogenase/dehydrogenase, beta subunit C-terminal domain [Deltaproteobacteria bacterium]